MAFSFAPLLTTIHHSIEDSYENVEHMEAQALTDLSSVDTVVFDVRELSEYEVSHLENALQINPGISRVDFEAQHGDTIAGKRVVFYCSVGRRSSNLAQRVSDFVVSKTHSQPINLKGGIFNWSNESRRMIGVDDTATDAVHPYNWFWGLLLKNREAISYGHTD